ncbi:hypothetical protein [Nocardia rhizosphaerae]|uniref:Uncharacterized protein n=1 Tax=Nocardia rhizosphaerae TaxID=1691571 RepID=A0ABV8LB54_9NOCA
MHWVFGVAGLIIALVVVDLIAVWAERRGWIYWRHRPRTAGVGSGVFGELESLMSPSYRHVVEETQSRQMVRIDQAVGEKRGPVVVVLPDDRSSP